MYNAGARRRRVRREPRKEPATHDSRRAVATPASAVLSRFTRVAIVSQVGGSLHDTVPFQTSASFLLAQKIHLSERVVVVVVEIFGFVPRERRRFREYSRAQPGDPRSRLEQRHHVSPRRPFAPRPREPRNALSDLLPPVLKGGENVKFHRRFRAQLHADGELRDLGARAGRPAGGSVRRGTCCRRLQNIALEPRPCQRPREGARSRLRFCRYGKPTSARGVLPARKKTPVLFQKFAARSGRFGRGFSHGVRVRNLGEFRLGFCRRVWQDAVGRGPRRARTTRVAVRGSLQNTTRSLPDFGDWKRDLEIRVSKTTKNAHRSGGIPRRPRTSSRRPPARVLSELFLSPSGWRRGRMRSHTMAPPIRAVRGSSEHHRSWKSDTIRPRERERASPRRAFVSKLFQIDFGGSFSRLSRESIPTMPHCWLEDRVKCRVAFP